MCSAWLPSASKSQESSFEISSIVRSLTANRPRLPGPITLGDEQGRSLSDIVSRLSFTINDNKSLNDQSINFLDKKNDENSSKNSCTESTINQISSPSLRRKERVNSIISQALWNTRDAELVELYSGDRQEVEGADWGSIKSFASRGEDYPTDAFWRSTLSQDQRTGNIPGDSHENDSRIYTKRNLLLERNSSSISSVSRGLEEVPKFLEIPPRDRKNILTKSDISDASNNLIAPSESKGDAKKTYSPRISISRKNSRDKLKKKSGTKCSKRKSSHRMRGRREKKLSSSNVFDNSENKSTFREVPNEKPKNSGKTEEERQKTVADAKRYESVVPFTETLQSKHREELRGEIIIPKPQKSRLELLKSRFATGLFLQQNAVAKPSRTVIPQSSRARAIFRPLAGIQEPEEPKPKDPKATPEKHSTETSKQPKNQRTPRTTPAWRPGGSPLGRAPSSTSPTSKATAKRTPISSKEEAKSQVLRSRTFVSARESKNDDKLSRTPNFLERKKLEVSSKGVNKNSKSLRILKEILAIKEEVSKPSKIPTIKSSQNSIKNFKTLLGKLADVSDTSIPSISSGRSVTKKLDDKSQDLQTQTSKIVEKSRSLQTVPEVGEKFNVFTETESTVPLSIDAQVACTLSSISLFNNKRTEQLKLFKVIETQTSKSLLICSEKKDVSLETLTISFPSKGINTDKHILIDSSTGKDKLEINNFSCDSQLTNTELSLIYSPINHVSRIKSIVNIDVDSNSMNSIVSTISSELMSSKKCLIDSCRKFSNDILQKHDEIIKIPEEVIKAFGIAAERAQNLYRAIEIYHEKILNDQTNNQINMDLKSIENSNDNLCDDNFHCGLKKLIMQQEVQIFIEDIMNAVDEKLINLNDKILINCDSKESSQLLMQRGNILPIVYGALCSLVFWSLQFSMSCDLT